MALERLRGRMPLLVFILLVILCLLLVGLVCACLDDGFAQAAERVLQTLALAGFWFALSPATIASLSIVAVSVVAARRASPALLQRFLF